MAKTGGHIESTETEKPLSKTTSKPSPSDTENNSTDGDVEILGDEDYEEP